MSKLPADEAFKKCIDKDPTPIDYIKMLIDSYNVDILRMSEASNEYGSVLMTGVVGDLEDLLGRFAGKEITIK